MKKKSTLEGKAKTRNGVLRLCFCLFCILLEVISIVLAVLWLNDYVEYLNIATRILAGIIALILYSKNKPSTMKMPWVILMLIFPIMGLALYLLIGLNGSTYVMKKRYKDIDEKLLPLLPENKDALNEIKETLPKAGSISSYLANNAKYPVYQNTDITYYDEAVRGLEAQLLDLSKAEKFIFMEYHAIEDNKAWKRIQDVLVERVKKGVEVRVFYDDMGSIGFINTDFVKKLQKLGIKCRVFNPFMPGLNVFLNNRDHRKITVIDGKVGFTGGYNLANEYFNYTHPYGEWKDTGIRLEGDAVLSLTVTFLEMWNAVKKKEENDTDFLQYLIKSDYHSMQKGYIQPYADGPMNGEQVGEEVYISMANKAEKYCYFMTPYLIITDEMTHALSLAAKRGVDVRIITPGIPDKKMIYQVTRSFYHELVKNGVRIYEWTPGFCHAKMSVADDCMATIGTINLDYRSLYHHFENGCYLVDNPAVLSIREDLEKTMGQSREVSEKYKTGRRGYLRLGQLFMRLFAGLL
ncbi:MAG: cardiolipin synthase [Candidatus Enterosoma sp.]|nr:cardiolipin synthase [Bacilli bacterium]MDY3047924.1 cardiolipin synthase [Candidatus Enterosoma sp.]